MDKLKQWVALTVVGVLAILAAGWFLLVSPKRQTASELTDQATAQDSANAALRTELASLKARAKDVPAEEAKLAKVATKIPDNPALPALIRSLDKASELTSVDVTSLSPAPAALVAPPAAATTPTTPTTPTAAKVGTAAPVVADAGSLAVIPVTMSVSGTYFQVLEFVDELEGLNRAFKVTALSVSPSTSTTTGGAATTTNKVTVAVTGSVYMAAGRAPLAPVTVPKPGK